MAYDDIKDKNQGSPKISEVFTDRQLDIISTQIGESGIKVLEQLVRISGDALRKTNYILWSPGFIKWDGSTIYFDDASRENDIYFRLLQTEQSAPRTIDLIMQASTTANSVNRFKTVSLANGELLYLELDRSTILGSSGSVDLENAVGGGSGVTGKTVKKVALSAISGMPALLSPLGGNTQTFYVPIAMRIDWTDGMDTYQDLWWIPHGIRWPMNVSSSLGSVIVKGFETWPTTFVRSQLELQNAISNLTPTGGIILVTEPFDIDTTITIPSGVSLVGRSDYIGGTNPSTLSVLPGGSLILQNRSKLERLFIRSGTSFGLSNNESMILMSGTRGVIEGCELTLTKPDTGPFEAKAVSITGNDNRLFNCKINNVVGATFKIGIEYVSGTNNIDVDTIFG